MKHRTGFTHWIIVILISVMAVGLVGVAWWYGENKKDDTTVVNTNTTVNVNASANTNAVVDSNTNTVVNTNTVSDDSDVSPSTYISEAGVTVYYPDIYDLTINSEENRRGSFVSYDFIKPPDTNALYFYEIQFFNEASITQCNNNEICFFGDYPDLDRYNGQMEAYAANQDFENYELINYDGGNFFTSSHRVVGDEGFIREYTTFISETKIDIWVYMLDKSQENTADTLFNTFSIE